MVGRHTLILLLLALTLGPGPGILGPAAALAQRVDASDAPADTLRDDASSWAARALAASRAGQHGDATRLFRRAAEATDEPGDRALHLSNAAAEASRAGNHAEAALLLEMATGALTTDVPDDTAGFVLTNQAQHRLREGRWEAAEAIALRAAERARAADDGATEARAWRIVADARRLTDHLDAAERALDVAERAKPSPREELEIGFVRGLLDLDRGRPREAAAALARVADGARADTALAIERRARLALAEACTKARRPQDAHDATTRARTLARDARDRADVEQRAALDAVAGGDRLEAARRIGVCLAQARAWIEEASGVAETDARCRVARSWVETALDLWFPASTDGAAFDVEPARFDEAREWVRRVRGADPHGAITREGDDLAIAWFWGSERVLAFAEWPGSSAPLHRARDCGAADELREWILLFRGLLADPSRATERDDVGRVLVGRLFPADAEQSHGRMLLEPDGPLQALPFAVLPTGAGPLGIVRSLVDATVSGPPPDSDANTTRAVRVLADPVLGPTSPLVPLPGARDEADAIARTGSEVEVWLGADATEARVRDRPPPAILHLAAHTDPRSPAVLLAPAEDGDGRLEPAEIRRIDVPARIVVLSGCETGLSDVAGRTSVGVLSSAFLDAGAGSVIGALWKVEDRAIGKLMAALHERLAAGDRPSEALRRARGAMILSGRSDLNDPFLWGAFVVRGRDEALPPVAAHAGANASDFADAMLGAAAAAGMLLLLGGTLRGRRRRNATPPPAGTNV